MTKQILTPADPSDIDATSVVDDFATAMSPTASSFRSIVEDAADGDEEGFDIDRATRDYVDAIDEATGPYGCHVTISGEAFYQPYRGFDLDGALRAARDVDVYDILARNAR